MPIETINSLQVGQTIRFKTKSNHDNVHWCGVITAFCDYKTAMYFEDITSYYADMVRSVDTPLTDKTAARYLVIRVSENNEQATMRVFGTEWIDLSTLEVIEENTYTDFRVYDVNSSKAEDIRRAIASLGYSVDILEKK